VTDIRGCAIVALLVAARALTAAHASAADPLNSSNRSSNKDQAHPDAHNEFNIVPVAGGTTDIGIGGGYFAGLAHLRPGYDPYEWNIESAAFLTFAPREGGGVVLPYQDFYLKFTVPRFFGSSIRIEIRPSYGWETKLNYFGLGDASAATLPPGAPHGYFTYGRLHPQLDIDLRGRIHDHLVGRAGLRYTQNWLQVADDSRLASDLRTGSDEVRSLLGSTSAHAVAAFHYGIQWDDRDNDVSAHRGTFDSLDVKLSPGGSAMFPYRYAQATATGRIYIPLWKPRITLAARVVADVLYGTPPFYELARFEDTYAIGGLNGVRGVPGQRYYGKVKALGNVEVRTEIVSFHALGKPLLFGVVAFLDGGRVWADTSFRPELDGRRVGLKYGVGGGLRLQSGSAFVIRADVAWSPDATPVGAYVAVGQMF
jgi:outer membrane protein assembly factor BamA